MILWLNLLLILVTAIAAKQEVATLEYINGICGQENSDYDPNKFPWKAVLLKKQENGGLSFHCGAVLVSTRTLLTTAHCFIDFSNKKIEPEDFLISLVGGNNSYEWKDALNFEIERIIQHPNYNVETIDYDADLAVVQLKQPVSFSSTVKPICLWSGEIDENAIVGKTGVVAARNDENDLTKTTSTTLFNATAVSQNTCLRSHRYYLELTSNRTLCVDVLDKEGLCSIKSGDGLMLKIENKWMLRGIVVAGIQNPEEKCRIMGYVIFSDVAKFNEWIRSNLLL